MAFKKAFELEIPMNASTSIARTSTKKWSDDSSNGGVIAKKKKFLGDCA